MQLTARLQAVANLVPQGSRLVDVGTDHARLPIWLLRHQRVQSAIASDLRRGPLQQAAKNVAACGLQNQIQLVQSPGLCRISPDAVDTITICGMGGETILQILEDSPWAREKHLLLQPQSNLALLRRFLQKSGYLIEREELCLDKGYYYIIWSVIAGTMPPLTAGEAYAGRSANQVPHPGWGAYLDTMIQKMSYELNFLRESTQPKDFARRDDYLAALPELIKRREELP